MILFQGRRGGTKIVARRGKPRARQPHGTPPVVSKPDKVAANGQQHAVAAASPPPSAAAKKQLYQMSRNQRW